MTKTPEFLAALQRIKDQPGLWFADDANNPCPDTACIPLLVHGGRIYSMRLDAELSDEGWADTVLFEGPFVPGGKTVDKSGG